jgi:hypothetical protein
MPALLFRRLLALSLGCVACESGPKAIPIDRVPAELAAPVSAAETALDALQTRLQGRLAEELAAGGPKRAVTVCRDEAMAITSAVAAETGISIGRTSHRLRNPSNTAPAWARTFIERDAAASPPEPIAVDLGDRVGVLRPLFVAAPCVQCHGPTEGIAPEVREILGQAYPEDRATGFQPGELRGWAWAEAAKASG